MLINISIKDVGRGVQMSGSLNADVQQPTPAEIVAMYIASNPEAVALQSWDWFASQRKSSKQNSWSQQ